MKEMKNTQIEEKKPARKGRWRRNNDGTYRYAGICPFNRAVCAIMNVYVRRKTAHRGV